MKDPEVGLLREECSDDDDGAVTTAAVVYEGTLRETKSRYRPSGTHVGVTAAKVGSVIGGATRAPMAEGDVSTELL